MTNTKVLTPIEERIINDKKLIIDKLKVNPIIQIACKKAGISRATYYRWRKDDPEFSKEANKALQEGTELISDMAESQLINQIRDENMTAIIFWLKHHRQAYENRVKLFHESEESEELTEEEKEIYKKALSLMSSKD
jgi:hypothetical protein